MKTFFKGNNLQSECKMHSIKRCQVCSHNMHVFRNKTTLTATTTQAPPTLNEIKQLAHKAFLSTDTLTIYSTLSHLMERLDQLETALKEIGVSIDNESKVAEILGDL